MNKLPDVQQNKEGFKKLSIEKVGVRGIKVPFMVNIKNSDNNFNTIAEISSYCNLTPELKGINMSRISRTINNVLSRNNNGMNNLNDFVYELQNAHKAKNIFIKAKFDYLYNTTSPMENIKSVEPINVVFESVLINGELKNYITIKTTEMSLCPCSKEMSLLKNNLTEEEQNYLNSLNIPESLKFKFDNAGFGAHNQKSIIEIKVETIKGEKNIIWIEDLIDLIQHNVSSPTFSTVKRYDEKWITETSYMGGYFDNGVFKKTTGGPMFVEDIVRNISNDLNKLLDKNINDYVVIVNNQESIHSDNIVATSVKTAGRTLK